MADTGRLCTICARGGSKGVPRKNLRRIAGRPLLDWTVSVARETGLFDHIAVSSDDADILKRAAELGVDFCIDRAPELATDESGKMPAIVDAVTRSQQHFNRDYDISVDLDVTSPLRLVEDITGAVTLLESGSATNVITGAPARRSPYFNMVEEAPDGHVRLVKPLADGPMRRQDAPRCFDMNASIYVWRTKALLSDPDVFYDDTLLYEMPESRSHDIDTELDFDIVEFLLLKRASA